jgi:photosynthetic reaction center cytochrome c subunit
VKLGSRPTILCARGIATACLLGVAPLTGQTASDQKPLMVEDVFKNVQVLKGIPVTEFMATMGFFSASLGFNCTNCHTEGSLGNWTKYADDVPAKRTARRMIRMVETINKENFGGRRMVTCYSCHRGGGRPKVIPSLLEQYSAPPPEDPNEVEIHLQPGAPSVDQVLDKYIQALGGAQRLAALASFVAKGTYGGYDTDFLKVPVEIYARAPGERTMIAHTPIGDSTTTFDGRAGWIAAPDKPVPLIALPAGPDLDGVKLEAELGFPARVKQALNNWRAGFPDTSIGERDVQVIQGTTAGGSRVKLFFDKESGLLARLVRFADSVVGINPIQIDYSDYRQVGEVKMPYHWTVTWTDGQSNIDLSEIQPNAAIDATRFRAPAPAARPPAVETPPNR